jgi:hypothetical protein
MDRASPAAGRLSFPKNHTTEEQQRLPPSSRTDMAHCGQIRSS